MTKLIIIVFIVILLVALVAVAFVMMRRRETHEEDNTAPFINNIPAGRQHNPAQADFSQNTSTPVIPAVETPAPRNSLMIAQGFLDQQRYDEAEAELKLGLQMHPTDDAIPLKLLNLYAVTNNHQSFQDVYAYVLDKGNTQTIQQAEQIKSLLEAEQASFQPASVQEPQSAPQHAVVEEDAGLDFQAFSQSLAEDKSATAHATTTNTEVSFDSLEDSLLDNVSNNTVNNNTSSGVAQTSVSEPVSTATTPPVTDTDKGLDFELSLESDDSDDMGIDFGHELSLEQSTVASAEANKNTQPNSSQQATDSFDLSLELDSADNQATQNPSITSDSKLADDDFGLDFVTESNDTGLSLDTPSFEPDSSNSIADDELSLDITDSHNADNAVVEQTQDLSFDLSLDTDTLQTKAPDAVTLDSSLPETDLASTSDDDGLDFSDFNLEIDDKAEALTVDSNTHDSNTQSQSAPLETDFSAFEDVNLDIDTDIESSVEQDSPVADTADTVANLDTANDLADFDFNFDAPSDESSSQSSDELSLGSTSANTAIENTMSVANDLEMGNDISNINDMDINIEGLAVEESATSVKDEINFEDFDLNLDDFDNKVLANTPVSASSGDSVNESAIEVDDTLAQPEDISFANSPTIEIDDVPAVSEFADLQPQSQFQPEPTESSIDTSIMPTGDAFSADLDIVNALDKSQVTLELASQYLDLGEYDSAKRLLNEVVEQGSAEQQQTAQTLLLQAG